MKRLLTIILAIIVILSMSACTITYEERYTTVINDSRFQTIAKSDFDGYQTTVDIEYRIIVDSETDIVYIMAFLPQGNATYGGMTPLLNENGEPMTLDEYRRN